MQWKHNFKHVDRSEILESHLESRFEKMEHLILRDSQWQVFYSFDKHKACVEISGGNGIRSRSITGRPKGIVGSSPM